MPRFVKLLNPNLIHHKFQYEEGLNTDDKFNPSVRCNNGLYFCEVTDMPMYLNGKYTLIADVEIPDDAKLCHESHKSKADKLILKNIRKIANHECWQDQKFCERVFYLSSRMNEYIPLKISNKIILDYIYGLHTHTKTIYYITDKPYWKVMYDYGKKGKEACNRDGIEKKLNSIGAKVVLGPEWAVVNRLIYMIVQNIQSGM